MHKLSCIYTKAATSALAALFLAATSIAIAPQADAGSGGCAALLKAAKKGYRGDPSALAACRAGASAAAHAARARPRALESRLDRDLRRANRTLRSHDSRTAAQMRGEALARIAGRGVHQSVRDRRRQEFLENSATILEMTTGPTPH